MLINTSELKSNDVIVVRHHKNGNLVARYIGRTETPFYHNVKIGGSIKRIHERTIFKREEVANENE